jgi:lipopolysaccharide transport system ATP-binding protein
MSIAIKIENVSKIYRLGEYGTGTLTNDFQRWFAKVRGKEDPYLTIGEENERTTRGGNIIYSLQNLTFDVKQGEAVGIIGRNGAGKSTLLKILSRITYPTAGRIHIKGRVASLLEVGTGFHPELTGKENIYLNGAIMGMRKKEIDRRLDEIIDFSGVERYIDTPVKRYSSGMYVRLAFAVAAHLESEILIVDEVLAVGDLEFQKKCLGKMDEVSRGDGRTVLFVSHNFSSLLELCTKGVYLKNGRIELIDTMEKAIGRYADSTHSNTAKFDNHLEYVTANQVNDSIVIEAKYNTDIDVDFPLLGFLIKSNLGTPILASNPLIDQIEYPKGKITRQGIVKATIKSPKLHDGNYLVSIWFGNSNGNVVEEYDCISLPIYGMSNQKQYSPSKVGHVLPNCEWEFID